MNFNWDIIGNDRAIEYLDKSLGKNNIANFYVFSGMSGIGKFSLARNFAKNIFLKDKPELVQKENFLKTNSDFFVLERESDKKDISIDQIRSLIERFKSSSFLGSYRIAIIKDAENLNNNSANALLKVLEEGGEKTVIILTVSDVENLPKTIISRGQVINLFPVQDDLIYKKLIDEFKLSPSLAKNLTKLSSGRPAIALKFLQNENLYQEYQIVVNNFFDFLSTNFSERLKIIDDLVKKSDFIVNFDILEIWQSILRDLIFVFYGQYEQVRNIFALEELKKIIGTEIDPVKIRKKSLKISEGNDYLRSNISLRSTLEYIAVNI
ncbi:MAG: hypothetical protein PHP37_04435 [Patescibacteria group bacterium]|nr:hypothetical protein [Patescibacteria group bacterium]